MFFSYLSHRRACHDKQQQRAEAIQSLPHAYRSQLTAQDIQILRQPVATLVSNVQSGSLNPQDVLLAYGKKALQAHAATNCLTEIMIATAETWAKQCNRNGPLAGMPISMKDTVGVAGYDSCIGYSVLVNKPFQKDSALVRLLRDAGAVPFVKTNIPITLLSLESFSDIWGRTTNPHSKNHSPGGSTGGEAALLAFGGSRLGIGTDVAGSVRVPAHYSGIYTIKASSTRFPKAGNATSMIGQEGVPPVYSPMARTLEDLETFWKAIFSMKPWEYDPYCAPIPWREVNLLKKVKWGVMWDDGVITPSPACRRALEQVVSVLKSAGHDVVEIHPPNPSDALKIGGGLLANACITSTLPIRWCETNDYGAKQAVFLLRLPRFVTTLHAWFARYILRDALYADLIESWRAPSPQEFYALIGRREEFRMRWFEYLHVHDIDLVLTVPNALPAMKHNESPRLWKACGYTFLFNVLDYSAGVLPITHVDRSLDTLPRTFKARNGVEASAYKCYDANEMHGLPVGVQVVGKRLEEEQVMEGMKLIEELLRKNGLSYRLLNE